MPNVLRFLSSLIAVASLCSAALVSTACSKQTIDVTGLTATPSSASPGTSPGANPTSSNPGSSTPATVSAIAPTGGLTTGSTKVTITGTAFATGTTVKVGGVDCGTVVIASSTQLTCITGAHAAGSVDVVVTATGASAATLASAFSYQANPTIFSVSPNGGALAGGTVVTITGVALDPSGTITVGGQACTPVVVSADQTTATCTVQGGPGNASGVVVTNGVGGAVATSGPNAAYTFRAAPTLTSISPSAGSTVGGTTLTLTGTGFLAGQSGLSVTVGAVTGNCSSPSAGSAISITCTLPAAVGGSAGAVNVRMINPDQQASNTLSSAYTFVVPAIASVTPATGPFTGNTSITIAGTGFSSGATVTVGGTAATNISVGAASITCKTPAGTAGSAALVVTNPTDGTSAKTASSSFYFSPAPTVSSVTPPTGSAMGGSTVTIAGSNFVSGATVTIGGSSCTSVNFVNSGSLTCSTPQGTAGSAVSVVVTNPDTLSNTLSSAYTYHSYVYASRLGGAGNTFAGADISPADGTLTATAAATAGGKARALAFHPSLKIAYVVNGAGNVEHFALNPTTGALASTGSAVNVGFAASNSIVVTSNGKFAFVSDGAGGDAITALRINLTSGALTQGATTSASNSGSGLTVPMGMAIAPSGVYVAFNGQSKVCAFSSDATLGDLTQIGTTCMAAVANASAVAVDGSGKYVFAIGGGNTIVTRLSIQGDGSLISAGADTNLPVGSATTGANALIVNGGYLYIATDNARIVQYTVDSATGALSSPVSLTVTGTATPALKGLAVDPTGKYLYASDSSNKSIIMFSIGGAGALTQQGGSPLADATNLNGVIGLAVTPR